MASSLPRLGAALPRARPRSAPRVLPPGRWDASRRAALNACRCQVHSDVKVAPTSDFKDGENSSENWRIKMLYDGDCPLCMREVYMLHNNPGTCSIQPLHNHCCARTLQCSAFRRLYEEVGLGWVYAVTKYEPVATVANAVYGVWTKYRMQITGRPPLEEILASRKTAGECKDDKVCKI